MTATLDLSATDRAPAHAGRMASAALDFLASLNEQQRQTATLPFGDDRRYVWDYRPPENTPRNGLRLINMTSDQQRKALALLDIGLSTRGATPGAQDHGSRDPAARAGEGRGPRHAVRPPPRAVRRVRLRRSQRPRCRGRGTSAATTSGCTSRSSTATASPRCRCSSAPIRPRCGTVRPAGQRTLPEEEDLARALVRGLPPEQKHIAIVSPTAYPDILTDSYRVANASRRRAVWRSPRCTATPRRSSCALLRHYVERTNDELSGPYWRKIEADSFEAITFAWAGSEEPGQGHYYAIKAPELADRVRQHPERREPHPLGAARHQRRLGRRPARPALRGVAPRRGAEPPLGRRRTAMLSTEDNELLCRVGPGTPMGAFMREYWLPAFCRASCAEPDGAPHAPAPARREPDRLPDHLGQVRPHGQQLPAPRRVAVLRPQRRRGPALRLPRLEVRRRRATASTCPTSRPKSTSRPRSRPSPTRASSATASSGPIWARASTPPPLPDWLPNLDADCQVWMRLQESNWLQALEGDIDTVHAFFLHSGHSAHRQTPAGQRRVLHHPAARTAASWPRSTRSAPATPRCATPSPAPSTGAWATSCCRSTR